MHSVLVAVTFIAMVLSPCLIASRTGLSGDREYDDDLD